MVKISISLPNNTHITFESEESEVLREIVTLALRDLPRDLMQPDAQVIDSESTEKGNDGTDTNLSEECLTRPAPFPTAQSKSDPADVTRPPEMISNHDMSNGSTSTKFLSISGRTAFEAFCKKANPLGDMRRVVVAAEGATLHFGVEGVNANDLGWLFDIAGWRRPGDLTQTLRNAARSKFGWLERIPGRSGRYAATPLGVSKTIPTI